MFSSGGDVSRVGFKSKPQRLEAASWVQTKTARLELGPFPVEMFGCRFSFGNPDSRFGGLAATYTTPPMPLASSRIAPEVPGQPGGQFPVRIAGRGPATLANGIFN